MFETNENRGNFLLGEEDSFDSETTDTDAEDSDDVELYAEKEGALQHGDTSMVEQKVKRKGGVFLKWDSSEVEERAEAFHHQARSMVEMEGEVFPDKDTLEAATPRPFIYYLDEEMKLRGAAHRYFDKDPETPNVFRHYSDESQKLSAVHRYFDENPEMDTKAPGVFLTSEKLDKDKVQRNAETHCFLKEGTRKGSGAPSWTPGKCKKWKLTDAELMPPPPLPARILRAATQVTRRSAWLLAKVNRGLI